LIKNNLEKNNGRNISIKINLIKFEVYIHDMSWRTDDGKVRKPKEIFPKITDIIKNHKFWNKRRMTYLGTQKFFDQEVRTGVCFFCKHEGRAQKSKITNLHHAKYDHSDPLAWTVEVCKSCHWQIDEDNRNAIARRTGKVIERPYGKYDNHYYDSKVEKIKKEERDRRDRYSRFCANIDGKFIPMIELCPDREFYDKLVKEMEKEKTAFKKDTMSNVSRRYW